MKHLDASDQAASDARELPDIEGFERCEAMASHEVTEFLADTERFDPREVDHLRRVAYQDRAGDIDEAGETVGDYLRGDVRLFKPSDDASRTPAERRARMEETLCHEVGHGVWERAPLAERARWTAMVHHWKKNGDEAHPWVSEYAKGGAEEHFCEAYAAFTRNDGTRALLRQIDSHRPPSRSLAAGVQRIRSAALTRQR